ncbi:MAG: LysR family transcriptional regulator [Actinobacteria bacterium]|nr:LysR family transcriptional regulator [Actinomycetota bacterium]
MNVARSVADRLLGIEFRHLAALEAIVETGSFAAAARRLGYTQSAISQQIAVLERVTEVQLLERPGGRRPVTATEAGARLLRHAARATAALRAAEADLHALAEGEAGTLRIATFQSIGVRVIPPVMRLYVARRPAIDVKLIEADLGVMTEKLVRGELDLAFVADPVETAIEQIEVLSDPYVLLAPAGSELAQSEKTLTAREIARLPLIAYRVPTHGGEAHLRSKGLEPTIVFRSDDSGIVQGLVGAGVGYALVPRLTVDRSDAAVAMLDVRGIPPREIGLAWHAVRRLSPAAKAFVEVVEEVAADLRAREPLGSR